MTLDDTFLLPGVTAPPTTPGVLRLGAFEPRSVVLGPGERAVVWVVGCLRRCPGCLKPEWFGFDTESSTSVAEITDRVLAEHARRPLAGVTFSGGEPFEQAGPLAELAASLKPAGLDALTYTGYRLAALQQDPRFAPLLAATDWLIDAEYNRDAPGPLPWRGSANQTIYRHADDRFVAVEDAAPVRRDVQVSLTAGGLRLTGFPDALLQRGLRDRLAARGIALVEHPKEPTAGLPR